MSCSTCTRTKKAPLCLSGTINIGTAAADGTVIIKNILTGLIETLTVARTAGAVVFEPGDFPDGFLTPNGLYEVAYTNTTLPNTYQTLTIGTDTASCWLLEFENYYTGGEIKDWTNYTLIPE